jgi:hypothetical protein
MIVCPKCVEECRRQADVLRRSTPETVSQAGLPLANQRNPSASRLSDQIGQRATAPCGL